MLLKRVCVIEVCVCVIEACVLLKHVCVIKACMYY